MKVLGPSKLRLVNRLKVFFGGLMLLAVVETSRATSPISTACPLGFFINVAARLLSTEMNADLNHIQVYPTNQYTPAVHRLLQVTANIYDATTTNSYPTIFRPLFTVDANGNVFISGYTNQPSLIDHSTQMTVGGNNDILDPPIDVTALPPGTNILANVYGVPWIIGAKKGLPNFNSFDVESAFQLVRKLEVMRDTNTSPPTITWTNQMYLMNITNFMGLSCWNSYRTNYPGPVDILVRCCSSIMLTNDNNLNPPYAFQTNFAFVTELPLWPGWNSPLGQQSSSFVVPLNTSVLALTNAQYYYNEPNPPNTAMFLGYIGDGASNYLDRGIRELPHFWLMMTNRLQVAIIDYSTNVSPLNASSPTVGQIVDYVQLGGMDSHQLLNSSLDENGVNSFWNTNYTPQGNLIGVLNQIIMSEYGTVNGIVPAGAGVWSTALIPGGPAYDVSPPAQQAFFRGFFAADGHYTYNAQVYYNTQSAVQAPYTPVVSAVRHTTWAANDPLVHYLSSDLAPRTQTPSQPDWDSISFFIPPTRYQPWGISTMSGGGVDVNPCNLAYKDPMVRSSDNWYFLSGQSFYNNWPFQPHVNVTWLGLVHRGTPWQTIYLKSTNILAWTNFVGQTGTKTWVNWTGDTDPADAAAMAPVQDWHLASLLTSMVNTNDFQQLFSVNNPNPNAWQVALNGLTATTNTSPGMFMLWTISSNAPQAATIANAIETARASLPSRQFADAGDILAVPQLTEQSPYFNLTTISNAWDAVYEGIVDQLLPFLRSDSIGSVSTVNGQKFVQFTGYDGHDYLIQTSDNLVDWTNFSTNTPVGGALNIPIAPPADAHTQFYRSVLLN